MPKPKAGDLTPTEVFVKLRPKNTNSEHATDHDKEGEKVEKSLERYDDKSVELATQYMFSSGTAKYEYMKRVVLPERTQEEAYADMMPPLVDRFTGEAEQGPSNVLFFAYGQSGTGKTHTMFGPNFETSLSVPEDGGVDENWGVFPRVVHDVLNRMKSSGNDAWSLDASAIEFFLMGVFDLLDKKTALDISSYADHKSYGEKQVNISSMQDAVDFLATAYSARTVQATKLNAGSSRSHCALTLTLNQLVEGKVLTTRFTLVDLAGAERLSKTGALEGSDQSPAEALVNALFKGEVTNAGTGLVINMELQEIGKEAVVAQGAHKNGKKYSPPKQMATAAMQFVGHNYDASVHVGMVACLSQAPQNGWETWFSLNFGQNISNLAYVLKKCKAAKFDKALKEAKETAKSTAEALKKTPKDGPSAKWRPKKTADKNVAANRLAAFERLEAQRGA